MMHPKYPRTLLIRNMELQSMVWECHQALRDTTTTSRLQQWSRTQDRVRSGLLEALLNDELIAASDNAYTHVAD